MAEALLIGVDGGGTRCRVRVATLDGTPVGAAEGGTANVFSGIDAALANILATVRAALAAAGEPEEALGRCHVGFGLAGANVPSVAAAFSARALPFASFALETDALAARRGAFAGRDGAIAILGTGSAYAYKAGGRVAVLGGFGPLVSDHGSGADLGRRALAEALLAHDGVVPATPLTEALMARFEGAPHAVSEFARDARPRDFGRFAPLIWDHLDAGDPTAERLVGEALGVVEGFARRCLALGAPAVALLGGQAQRYRPRLSADLARHVVEPAGDALSGALDLARESRRGAEAGAGAGEGR